jgi:hypothetical protein
MTRRLLVALALLVVLPAVALAKCAASADEGLSPNKKWKAVPTLRGTFTFLAWDESKKNFQKKHEGEIDLPGHHVKTLVADSGEHFVLFDSYGGLALFTSAGKVVKRFAPSDLLTEEELAARPNKWACHTEGEWSQTLPTIAADSKTLKVTLHSKRAVTLDLATGAPAHEWIVEGTCASPDKVKMHGAMNCVTQDWTCARCKKLQRDSLVWRLCADCCKELQVCFVCNKKVEKEKPEKR